MTDTQRDRLLYDTARALLVLFDITMGAPPSPKDILKVRIDLGDSVGNLHGEFPIQLGRK